MYVGNISTFSKVSFCDQISIKWVKKNLKAACFSKKYVLLSKIKL